MLILRVMKKINFKSGIIGTLPNIDNLDTARIKLYSTGFKQFSHYFMRKVDLLKNLPISSIKQIIPLKEKLNPLTVKKNILNNGFEGYILPMSLMEEALKYHPLPLSAQKQTIIDHICRMNNGAQNEAEGICINIQNTEQSTSLAPNLASQIIANLHFNSKSRLTIGSAKSITDDTEQIPNGEAMLQISHLMHHVLDIDLSTEITSQNLSESGIKRIKSKVSLYENCFSIPYKLTNTQYSTHGFVLYLKGKITLKQIQEIIGLKQNGWGGLGVITGTCQTTILNSKTTKKFGFKKTTKFYEKSHTINCNENLASLIFEPTVNNQLQIIVDQAGLLTKVEGEIVIAFYPFLQSFVCGS